VLNYTSLSISKGAYRESLLYFSVTLFLLSFILSPSYSIIHGIFYILVIPVTLSHYDDISLKDIFNKYKWILLFLIYYSLSSLWSEDYTNKFFFREIKSALSVGLGCIFLDLIYKNLSKEKLFNILFCCSIFTSIIIVINLSVFYYNHPITIRMAGFFASGQEIKAAWLLGPVVLFLLHCYLQKNFEYNNLSGICALPLIMFIIMTQSRGPILALFVTFLLLLFQNKNYKMLFSFVFALALFLIYFCLIAEEARGSSYRILIWTHFIELIIQKPFIGYGILAETEFTQTAIAGQSLFKHSHNAYLACLFHGGIIGGLLFAKIIYDSVLIFIKNYTDPFIQIIFAILLFALVCFLTDGTLPIKSPRPVWLNFWLPIALMYLYRNEKLEK